MAFPVNLQNESTMVDFKANDWLNTKHLKHGASYSMKCLQYREHCSSNRHEHYKVLPNVKVPTAFLINAQQM